MRLAIINVFVFLFSILISCTSTHLSPDVTQCPIEGTILEILTKPNLKVLDIGNSYTDDATELLPIIVNNSGAKLKDMVLCKLVRGSASFQDWCNVHNDCDTKDYFFRKVIGDLSIPLPVGNGKKSDGSLFRRVLSEVEWDIIIIHQYSAFAPYHELWGDNSIGGYLDTLLGIIKSYRPKAEIGFLIVHSYWDLYERNTEHSSFIRWGKIADSVNQIQEKYNIKFIIPYGTAVENLRLSCLNNEFDLTMDGSHCGKGLCQYTAACCYYESLVYPRTGLSCLGNAARIDVSNLHTLYPTVNVTDDNAIIAQLSAVLALKDMYHCNNPEGFLELYVN